MSPVVKIQDTLQIAAVLLRKVAKSGPSMGQLILCVLDEEEHSDRVLECAANLALNADANIVITAVLQLLNTPMGCIPIVDESGLRRILRRAVWIARSRGIDDVSWRLLRSTVPSQAIAEAAAHLGADRIVIGARKAPRILRFFVRSVPDELSRRTPCPVTVLQ